jgi:hypothetical protein
MPSSEDYTLVWAGVYRPLRDSEAKRAAEGTHPLMKSAENAGLDCWYDSFETTPGRSSRGCLLIGKHLKTLGYKEGATKYQLSGKRLGDVLAETKRKFVQMKITMLPKIYVLVHIEDVD